jgi:hypothetical protein
MFGIERKTQQTGTDQKADEEADAVRPAKRIHGEKYQARAKR